MTQGVETDLAKQLHDHATTTTRKQKISEVVLHLWLFGKLNCSQEKAIEIVNPGIELGLFSCDTDKKYTKGRRTLVIGKKK